MLSIDDVRETVEGPCVAGTATSSTDLAMNAPQIVSYGPVHGHTGWCGMDNRFHR
jgi:hypothetical protein